MANETNHQDNLEYIQELLSPYLDGAVTDEERALVEQAIASSPELRQELETLRQTVAIVKALPPMSAPRPFTLSEADVRRVAPAPKKSFWFSGWAGGLALLATALVCVLVAGGIFLSSRLGQNNLAPAEVARSNQAVAPQAAEVEAEAGAAEPTLEKATEEEGEEANQEAAAAAPAREAEVEKEAEPAQSADSLAEKAVVTTTEGEAASEMANDSAENVGQTETFAEQEKTAERDTGAGAASAGEVVTGAAQATALPSPSPVATPTPLPQPTPTAKTLAMAPEAPAEAAEGKASTKTEEAPVAQSAPAPEAGAEEPAEETITEAATPTAQPESLSAAVPQNEQSQTSQAGNVPEETAVPPTSTPSPQPSPTFTPQPTPAPPATPTPRAEAISAPPSGPGSSSQNVLSGFIWGAILLVFLAILVIAGIVIWWVINKKS